MLELYHAGLTTCSKKARHCLKEKGLSYKSHYMRLDLYEHHTPEYLSLNPNGVVPTLVHDGKVIIESGVINEYLDDVFPDRKLRPTDPLARARMRVFGKMADEYGLPATRIPTWTRSKTAMIKAMDDATFAKMLSETPLVDHRLKYQAIRDGGFGETEFSDSYGKMDYCYARCETALADGAYLAGEEFSLADIAMLPFIDSFRTVRPELTEKHPRTRDWLDRMMERPAVQQTYQPSDEAPARQRPAA